MFSSHTYIVTRAICLYEDEIGIPNCSQADDEILAPSNSAEFADGKIETSQVLIPGAKYHAIIKIRIKDKDSTEAFSTSSDWQPFIAPAN